MCNGENYNASQPSVRKPGDGRMSQDSALCTSSLIEFFYINMLILQDVNSPNRKKRVKLLKLYLSNDRVKRSRLEQLFKYHLVVKIACRVHIQIHHINIASVFIC